MSTSILRRASSRMPADRRERLMLADGLRRLRRGPGKGAIRPLYPIVRPAVAAACDDSLARIDVALRDDATTLPEPAVAAVRRFLEDGAASPLYGASVERAAAAASALEHDVLRAAHA